MKDRTEIDRDDAGEVRTSQRTMRPAEPLPADSASTNPEVMEQSRPRTSQSMGAVDPWPEMSSYIQRFDAIQGEFIEEPKAAVQKAETLVGEAVDKMTAALHEQIRRIQSEAGDDKDTERLRVAMRSYKSLIHYLGDHRAA
jgi:hypothetical protein